MHSSWRRTRSLTCSPTTEMESFRPRWAIFRAASHGGGGAQLSPPSEIRITVRSPEAPRSSGAFSSERPIGVRPLPSSASTWALNSSRSSGPTGVTRFVSLQPRARDTPLSSLPYTRRPTCAPSGTASISSPSAALAASSRVPPSPASSFMESDPSRMTSTERSDSSCALAAGAAARRARTQQSVPRRSPGTLAVRSCRRRPARRLVPAAAATTLLAREDLADGLVDGVADDPVEAEAEDGDEDERDDGEDAAVLDGRLAVLVVVHPADEVPDGDREVLDGDGGADGDVLHGVTP